MWMQGPRSWLAWRGKKESSKSSLPQPTGKCELMDGQFCQSFPNSMNLLFALDKKAETREQIFKKKDSFEKSTRNELPVVPCGGIFLHPDSAGTKAWKKKVPDTKFRGCYGIEEDIINLSTLSVRIRESHGKRYDVGLQQELVERWAETKDSSEDEFSSKFAASTDGKRRALSMEEMTRLSEKTLVEINKNKDDPAHEPILEAHITERIEARLRLEEKHRRYSPKFVAFVKSLTIRQRRAARHVYLQNTEELTQSEIAKKIGISLDSLKDRLKAVKIKLKEHYSEKAAQALEQKSKLKAQQLRDTQIEKAKAKKLRAETLKPCRYLRPALGIDMTYLCRGMDPHPFGGEIRLRENIDADEIKRKIQTESCQKLEILYRSTEMIAPPRSRDDPSENKIDEKIKKRLWRNGQSPNSIWGKSKRLP